MKKVVYIVYEDRGAQMIPKSRDGLLQVYGSFEEAEQNRRMLSVTAAIHPDRIPDLLQEFDLEGTDGP